MEYLRNESCRRLVALCDRIQGVEYTALGSQGGTLWDKYKLKVVTKQLN
ncbi:hypothetical protein [Synechocystis sp. PCC 7509]|nr:hypothetical protein [Synechocystis sp. PCC 7509]